MNYLFIYLHVESRAYFWITEKHEHKNLFQIIQNTNQTKKVQILMQVK
jgi:hypothetical protein